jgi:hypothetical protein
VARPGISSARFRARAVFYHLAKVIVVLEPVAAFESKSCQRDVIHLLCPLVGLAVARGCPSVGLLESTRRSKAFSSATMRFISAATYAGQSVRTASSLSSV